MSKKKKLDVSVWYNDTQHPGIISVRMPGNVMGQRMTIHEAAELSESLAEAVRASGYDMVARKRR